MSSIRGGGFPDGPWVLVVGMHRSGTSAMAGVLGRLGLQLPATADVVTDRFDNPAHYESRSLNKVDEALLRVQGGSWSGPPVRVPEAWERSAEADALLPQARRAAGRAFPHDGPVAWKDPRLSLVLPFWRRHLPAEPRVVLVWRRPMAAARSLHVRQNFTMSLSLALWMTYLQRALAALGGLPVMVVSFEDLVRDPAPVVAATAQWLRASGSLAGTTGPDVEAAVASVSAEHLHQDAGTPPEPLGGVVERLRALEGAHASFPEVTVEELPPWALDALRQRREFETLYLRYLRGARWRRRLMPWRRREWAPPG